MTNPRILRIDSADGLCTLTLDRPDKLNALDDQTFAELDELARTLETEADRIGCVVLRGNGRAFCAGADLGGIGSDFTASQFKPSVIARLSALPQPLIVAVHGVCFTGGLELALAADLILADASARFADTHGKWGLVGAWGMTQRLPRRIGLTAAKRLMFTAKEIGASEAKDLGLVDILVESGGLDNALTTLTADILANSWHTNMATKRLLRDTDGMALADGLAHESDHYPGFAPDYADRIARFTAK